MDESTVKAIEMLNHLVLTMRENKMTEFQTRSETTGMQQHASFALAIDAAIADPTIWKVSYSNADGSRTRLVRDKDGGLFRREDMTNELV